MDAETRRERAVLYLYGELSPEEKARFEADLAADPELRAILGEEERLGRILPIGGGTTVPDDLLTESRAVLRSALRGEAAPRAGRSVLSRRWILPRSPRVRIALGMAAALLVGLGLGRILPDLPGWGRSADGIAVLPAGLIGPADLEVVDLRVRDYNPSTGRVRLSLDAVGSATVEGNLTDLTIRKVLAASLRGDLEPGPRLRAIRMLAGQAHRPDVRAALIHALLQDDNPGVRIKALEALAGRMGESDVRKAVSSALALDRNPGVRVRALESLLPFVDSDILKIMEARMTRDENPYIRSEARRIFTAGAPAGLSQKGTGL